jgi:histidinol-phosphate aminotransferase
MFDLNKITRNNIKNLVPYSSARDEFKGNEGIFLDANENSFGSVIEGNFNRYPDPLQKAVKTKLAEIKKTFADNIFLGNGSDEAIDILFRAFCEPGIDNVIVLPPTYGMYEVSANINNIEIQKVNLTQDFQPNLDKIISTINANTKLIFICSPNNPTANLIDVKSIEHILRNFSGIVVVDEAYIDFTDDKSIIEKLDFYPNLVILQTFSKAWGLAGLRIGMAFASKEIIRIFNKIKPPYNVNILSQELALKALGQHEKFQSVTRQIVTEREKLKEVLKEISFINEIYPSDANFILVKTSDAQKIYDYLVSKKIIVRNRSKITLCDGCLRITVGTENENKQLTGELKLFEKTLNEQV